MDKDENERKAVQDELERIGAFPKKRGKSSQPDKVWATLPDAVAKPNGQFRLLNQRIMLTYKTHIDKDAYIEAFGKKIGPTYDPVPFIRLAHETGDETVPYDHTHVVVDFGKPFATRDCRKFDVIGVDGKIIHPHIKRINTVAHFDRSKHYLSKEDPENDDLVQEPSCFKAITSCDTIHEALEKHCKSPTQASGIITLWNYKKPEEKPDRTMYFSRWQKQFQEILEKPVNLTEHFVIEPYAGTKIPYTQEQIDELRKIPLPWVSGVDRKIGVIYCPTGKKGKTVFGQSLCDSNPKRYAMMQTVMNLRDAASWVGNQLQKGWNGDTLFINIPRACRHRKGIYTTIEAIRDGKLSIEKYYSGDCTFQIKHLVLFTNFIPRLGEVTMDRWQIWEIDHQGFLKVIPLHEGLHIMRTQKLDDDSEEEDNSAPCTF